MENKEKDKLEPILLLEQWISSADGSTIDNETLSYACLLVSGAMINHDYETLTELKNRLTPLAAKISRRLYSLNIPPADLQASGIPVMSSLVRAAFQYLEWNDPVSTLKRIRYGEEILSILIKSSLKNSSDKKDSFVLNLPFIEKTLAENKTKLSQATISRCIKLLEQKAFIHLMGATRSRKCHILQKAWQWYEAAVKTDEKKSMDTDMRNTTIYRPAFIPSPYIENEPTTVKAETPLPENIFPLKRVGPDPNFSLDNLRGESASCAV